MISADAALTVGMILLSSTALFLFYLYVWGDPDKEPLEPQTNDLLYELAYQVELTLREAESDPSVTMTEMQHMLRIQIEVDDLITERTGESDANIRRINGSALRIVGGNGERNR